MVALNGCDSLPQVAKDVAHKVEEEWNKIEHSPEIQNATAATREALQKMENALKSGSNELEKKALVEMKAIIHTLYSSFKSAMKPLDQPYVISPKCLLAMAVGGGAVTATTGLGLAALGFASEGVEAGSLAALWQSSMGDVEAGSLFARLQSLGAKGLAASTNFEVSGILATISACFCGVVDNLCHHMTPNSPRSFHIHVANTSAGKLEHSTRIKMSQIVV